MYALLLFILFPVLYKYSRTWYFLYGLLFFLLGRFIAYKLEISYATIIHNVFFIGILVPFMLDNVYIKYIKPVFLWTVTYVAYLFILSAFHGNDFLRDLKDNFRVLFVFIFVVQAFENILRNKINLAYFVKVFKLILMFEILLCWMQYFFHDFGNFFRITEYTWNGEVRSMSGASAEMVDNNLCFGTLMGSSAFANYLTTSIVTLFLAKHKNVLQFNDYVFLAFCVVTLLITGIRAPFLVLLIMLYFILLRGKKAYVKIIYLVLGFGAAFFLLPILSKIGSQGGLQSFDNSVMRSLNVFTQFETGSISEEGTLTWPLSMIPYIVQHPLFGNGLHYGSGYYMPLNMHVLEDVSISDAGIFFYWAEYGLIGLLVFYFFYYYIVKVSANYGYDKSDIRFLVILLFLLSIVDCSVSNNYCVTVFALAPILIKYYSDLSLAKNKAFVKSKKDNYKVAIV